MKENNSLLIMAGGASSRMKRSLKNSSVGDEIKRQAEAVHKSLIPLGPNHHPLLFFLIKNAEAAGYQNIYLITSPKNESFHFQIEKWNEHKIFTNTNIRFALQHVPESREKPLGTADAIQQALEQYPELIKTTFTVCNGDNLYSCDAFKQLRKERKTPNALISYARSALNYSDERLVSFAVMDIDSQGYLKALIEKPNPETIEKYRGSVYTLRRGFEALRARVQRVRHQQVGDEIDLDALVRARIDSLNGEEMSERILSRLERRERDIAVVFMVDVSGSTKGWINDAERECLVLLCEALQILGDRYAIYGLSLIHI